MTMDDVMILTVKFMACGVGLYAAPYACAWLFKTFVSYLYSDKDTKGDW